MKVFLILFLATAVRADDATQVFIAANNDFTSSLYEELLLDNTDNILVSPFSIETVLGLVQSGAGDATGAEIRSALHLPDDKETTDNLFKQVLPIVKNQGFTLHTANKVYVEDTFPIKDTFATVALNDYEAAFENIEFAENVEAAQTINKWVENETDGKIKDLLQSDDITDSTRLVLVNALYFEANWTTPFVTQDTRKAAFFRNEIDSIDVDMMFLESVKINYAESDDLDAQIIQLPLEGDSATMLIVLPRKKEGIAILEKQETSVLANEQYTEKFVQIYLPKFQIESAIDLVPILQDLGVKKAFSTAADFSGIAGTPGELVLGEVRQKTFISVNEVGVTAAAATVAGVPIAVVPPVEEVFVADHPFAFYIEADGIILFEGRVLIPSYDN